MPCSVPCQYPPVVVGSLASAAALETARSSVPACDWLELRVDGLLREMTPEEIAAVRLPLPLLITVRAEEEGGLYHFDSHAARARLARLLLPAAAAVDWEIEYMDEAQELVQAAHEAGVPVVASAHDFEQTPAVEILLEKERRARALGADIVKFAFRLNSPEDMLAGLRLLRQRSGSMAIMGMGTLGPVSRLMYAQYGSCLVYGYLGDTPTAPGQWSASMFRAALATLVPGCAEG